MLTNLVYRRFAPVAAPVSLVTWAVSVLLILVASFLEEADAARDFGRWGIFLALLALAMTSTYLASTVIARLTQIMALFHDDVVMHEPKHAANVKLVGLEGK